MKQQRSEKCIPYVHYVDVQLVDNHLQTSYHKPNIQRRLTLNGCLPNEMKYFLSEILYCILHILLFLRLIVFDNLRVLSLFHPKISQRVIKTIWKKFDLTQRFLESLPML